MNHSCNPNTFVVFEGDTLCVRSLRQLAAGEEINQCYADVEMDVLLRQQVLKSEYFFDCCCEFAVSTTERRN
jgi:SET and MYND domain-containing protein